MYCVVSLIISVRCQRIAIIVWFTLWGSYWCVF